MAAAERLNRSDAPNEDSNIICKEDLAKLSQKADAGQTTDRPPDYCLALIGKTGHGKSDTGNTILGAKTLFQSSSSGVSVTKFVTTYTRPYRDLNFKVVDTPGCMDTELNDKILKEIAKVIDVEPGGYDAFLFVVRYPIRWTREEQKCLKQLEILFGKKFYDYCIVVFTYGDNFVSDQEDQPEDSRRSFKEYIENEKRKTEEGSMHHLLTKVKSRAVLFDNKGWRRDLRKREDIMDNLLSVIQEMQRNNEKSKYNNILFQESRRLHEQFPDNGSLRLEGLRKAIKQFYTAVMKSVTGNKNDPSCTCM